MAMMMREMLVPGRYIRVDSRGHWGVLQQQFAQTAAASDFPGSLAPMHLVSAPTDILAGSSGSGSGGTLGGMGSSGLGVRSAGSSVSGSGGGSGGGSFCGSPESTSVATPSSVDATQMRRLTLCADHPALEPIRHALKTASIDLSPLHEITLLAEARDRAGIPAHAVWFSFAHPANLDWDKLASVRNDTFREAEMTSPACLVALTGAFVYLDAAGEIAALNAVSDLPLVDPLATPDETLMSETRLITFAKPLPLPDRACTSLGKRLKPVTFAKLLAQGAQFFAWILPHEELPGLQRAPEGGAFAYVFRDAESSGMEGHRAIYFPVAT